MNATNKWLDAAKEHAGLPSDYALAKALGISRGRISNYRVYDDRGMGDDLALKIAELAGVPAARVLAELRAEKTNSDAARDVWLQVARNASRLAACLAIVGVVMVEPTARAGLDNFAPPAFVAPYATAGFAPISAGSTLNIMLSLIGLTLMFFAVAQPPNRRPVANGHRGRFAILPPPSDVARYLVTPVTTSARQISNFFRSLEK